MSDCFGSTLLQSVSERMRSEREEKRKRKEGKGRMPPTHLKRSIAPLALNVMSHIHTHTFENAEVHRTPFVCTLTPAAAAGRGSLNTTVL